MGPTRARYLGKSSSPGFPLTLVCGTLSLSMTVTFAQSLCTIGIARSTWVDFLCMIGRHIVFERTGVGSTRVDLAISNVDNQWGTRSQGDIAPFAP